MLVGARREPAASSCATAGRWRPPGSTGPFADSCFRSKTGDDATAPGRNRCPRRLKRTFTAVGFEPIHSRRVTPRDRNTRPDQDYGELFALKSLELNLKKGDVFGFIGPNGAGKTTTMRILATLLQPDLGRGLRLRLLDLHARPRKSAA